MDNNYIAQRLSAIGATGNLEVEALKAENTRLREQLGKVPQANFKSEIQTAFEQSPEFETILNAFYMRFLRDKFSAEFRNGPYVQEFQNVANQAFSEFEKNVKKEEPKNAQNSNSKKANGAGGADNKQND